MTFAQRFSLVLLAAFFLSTIAASAAAWLLTSPLVRMSAASGAAVRATVLAGWRLLPAIAALAATALILAPGYYRHEQRAELEGVSPALWLFAAAGMVVIAAGLARAARAMLRTAALRREWRKGAEPVQIASAGMPAFKIDSPYPLVAVLGAIRPSLFISSSVLKACPAGEIAAIVQHERRHVRSGDNAMRLLMEAAPDLLAHTRVSDAIAREWHRAIEHRADAAADDRLTLASALVRVARLSGQAGSVALPASALYRGDGVEDRVRRLVSPRIDADCRWRSAALAGAALVVAIGAAASAGADVSRLSHHLLESLVSMR